MKKKILIHVILSDGFAGSEKYVCDLLEFQKKYFKVYLIISNKNLIIKKFLNKNIRVFQINFFFQSAKIKKIINKINPDIVHTHLGEATKKVKSSSKYILISTLHMNYKKNNYQHTDALIVSNSSQQNALKKAGYKGKIFKMNLWVKLPKINISKSIIKNNLKIPKNHKIIGSIGRFHPQKGFDLIIRSFLLSKLRNTSLVLIGNGHKKFKYLEKNNRNIRILDHVENQSNYYNIFDIGIFMSRWETFGYTLIEAMKFKIPIISSVHVGNKDWLKFFNVLRVTNGKIVNFNKILKNNEYLNKKKINYDLEMFNYKKNCLIINNIYKKLLRA